jgi:hypothetical protein
MRSANRITLAVAIICGFWCGSLRAAEPAFFVAPDGNDNWSGKLARPNANKTDGPFATPHKARDAVRALRKRKKLAAPVVVSVAAGRYELREPLTFTPDDSGTGGSPTVFQAAGGKSVILSGGRRVTGWKRAKNGLWSAPWKESSGFRFLSVNGKMRLRPRLPAKGFYDIAGLAGADPKGKYDTPANKFEYAPGQIHADWKNLTDVEVVVLHFWVDTHLKVKSVDPAKRVVTFDRSSRRKFTSDHGPKPARYYVLNVFEGLTEPGHFYHDRRAGVLYYRPAKGEDMASASVVVPVLPQVVRFAGEPEKSRFVEQIQLRGSTLSDAFWEPAAKDAVDNQAASNAPGTVVLRGARHCAIENCAIRNVTGYALELLDGSRGNLIARNDITRVGAGGIKITGGAAKSPRNMRTGENRVADNHLHWLGELFHSGVGVLLMHGDHNTVAHNSIHDLYYTGISCGWVWGYAPSVSQGNVIEHNLIYNIGKKMLSDMGGIYMLGVSPGTVVRGNVIHDVDAFTYGGWGIYTDEGSTDILIENNLVYRTKTGGFHQHYGKENVVRNNIFALAREDQIQRSRAEPHISFTFTRNIVYYNGGTLLGKVWNDNKFKMDYNLYWNTAGPVHFPGGLTLQQWQARGFDKHSIVADPRFVNPAKGDFHLREDSPAKSVGFVPFDYTRAGVRKK